MSDSEFAYTGNENLEIMQHAPNYNRALCSLVKAYLPGDARQAMDFGAGIGTFSQCLAPFDLTMHCVEPDNEQRKLLEEQEFSAVADVQQITDGQMDYVFSLNVLEHIEDDVAACQELYRTLRPGGHLMIYVPAFQVLFTRMDVKVGHFRRYTRKSLSQCLKAAGFEIEMMAYYDFLGFFATLALKFLDRRSDGTLNPGSVRFYDKWLFPVSHFLSKPFSRLAGKNLVAYAKKP